MRRIAALMVAGAVAVGMSACGGSDGGGGDSAKAPATTEAATPSEAAPPPPSAGGGAPSPATKRRYIKQADRICRAAKARLVPIRAKVVDASKGSDPTLVYRQYAALTARAAAVYTDVLGQIQALDAPPADQAEIDKLEGLLGQIAGIMRQNSQAAAAQDAQRLRELNAQATAVAARYSAAAKDYGLRQCGQTAGALQRRGNR
jgi:hypothetical protein